MLVVLFSVAVLFAAAESKGILYSLPLIRYILLGHRKILLIKTFSLQKSET